MQLLVAYASKHGSTAEMAEAIGLELETAGHDVDVKPMADVDRLGGYDAVVLGSAVYVGRWLPEATSFVEANAASLGEKPVWLFSSGPVGEPEPKPVGDPEGLSEISDRIKPRHHRVLPGKIDRSTLSFGEKVITSVVRAPEGDFRDWPAISEYAREIAAELGTE
jgi:menaquinone-dependent protoporphyrinogen oxidase